MALKQLPKHLVTQIDALSETVPTLTISDPVTYRKACESLALVQQMRKTIAAHYQQIKNPLNATRKTVLTMEKADLAKIAPAETRLQTLITTYEDGPAEVEAGVITAVETPDWMYRLVTPRPVVEDLDALIAAVHRGDIPRDVLTPHLPTLTAMAKQQGDLFAVPGVRVEHDTTVVTRG